MTIPSPYSLNTWLHIWNPQHYQGEWRTKWETEIEASRRHVLSPSMGWAIVTDTPSLWIAEYQRGNPAETHIFIHQSLVQEVLR